MLELAQFITLLLSGALLVRVAYEQIKLRVSQRRALVELRLLTKELKDSTPNDNVP
jgi:hypothetical protein